MKRLLIGIAIIFLTMLTVRIYLVTRNNPEVLGVDDKKVVSEKITVQTKTIQEETDQYVVDAQYPNITGYRDRTTQETINSMIQNTITTEIATFKQTVATAMGDLLPFEGMEKSELSIRYEEKRVDADIASFLFIISDYQYGAAHPNVYTKPFNYSVKQKQEMKITEIFKKDTGYVDFLSKEVQTDLTAQDTQQGVDYAEFIMLGTEPKIENFQKFVLTKEAVVFVFDPYLVAPSVAGIRTVTIPYQKLVSYLVPSILL